MPLEEVTSDEFFQSLANKESADARRRIVAQLTVEGSFVNQMLDRLERAAENPFAIAWGQLLEIDDEEV